MRSFVGRVLFPAMEFLQGRDFRSVLEGLLHSQFLSYEELRSRQDEKLRGLVEQAYANVPFYKRAFDARGIRPADIRTLDDLPKLPVLSREDIRRNFPADMTAGNVPGARRRLDRTSGSTGVPLVFYQDRAGRDLRLASFLLFDSWAGIQPGDRSVHVGAPQPLSLGPWLFDRLRSRRAVSVFEMNARDAVRIIKRLQRLRPALVEGYASAIFMLAQLILQQGTQGLHPRAVVTTSDTLPSGEVIGHAFDCPVFERYGNREMGGALAQNCSAGRGLHVNTELCIIEVVDDEGGPVAPGQRGRLLLTDLTNAVMPFIRYDSGDMAVAGGSCDCGRGFPLLSRIEGRSSECLILPGGGRLSPVAFSHFLFVSHNYADHILKYQAEQVEPDRVVFRFVPLRDGSGPWVAELRADLRKLLGSSMTVEIAVVEEIPPEPSGKQAVLKPCRSPSPKG